ncbi:hypothetical protein MTX26_13350 [Bradyrhizobium sp. ISRA443]|uniref:hypothetical protein n=1 Tax=unclassified Bradyrhizobium TaxID=2631580 RepID=UPI00247834CC|nr:MULTISPECIES: hypothetical protein [unclassified Bradyrhizobium]WGR91471.1 hypothetical protein MTX20_23835 [Bradyrhizobium sp. ISRA435]WGS01740.1 hypothetical protein MTX23_13360 [Bradyrhizobium sp. ISRA436]WGS08626.1 hypothetical protein MTX18_13350 [Bradyrhizobium sp. ISRA437]WGS15514.1 hypothetical protein MTX26_13350 [Bradyrhizobium sp. ISRA443]
MSSNWRISSCNGALLAAYFIPVWTLIAFNIMVSPIHGLYERPSVSIALYASDHLQLAKMATVRLAWLLALARITVVAFFAVFLVMLTRPSMRKSGGCDEALAVALCLGSVLSFTSMLLASKAGELEALRMHAAELLMLLGTAIVMLVEKPVKTAAGASVAKAAAPAGKLSLQQP